MQAASIGRIAALDQFRGYAVLGMLFVNFMGHFQFIKPTVFAHHNTYFSYADSIMPNFLFAVGFAMRLTWLKRRIADGWWGAASRVAVRCLGLALLATVVYGVDRKFDTWAQLQQAVATEGWIRFLASNFERNPFQTLMHIAVTGLFLLPVIGASVGARIAFASVALVLHAVVSNAWYFDFAWSRPVIDGGPLGILTWATPAVVGSVAYDVVAKWGVRGAGAGRLALLGIALMITGYLLSCPTTMFRGENSSNWFARLAEPPFVAPRVANFSTNAPERDDLVVRQKPNYAMMSQRAGTPSYLVFAAGFSLLVFVVFLWTVDVWGWSTPIFRTFGTNALVAYLIHGIVGEAVQRTAPADAPPAVAFVAFAVFLSINWMFVRSLERRQLYLRL